MTEQHSAILFFSLTASEESKTKSFVPDGGQKGNFAVAKALIQHSFSVARKTELPIFRSSGANQRGTNFGERLANAIESVFKKGFHKVIVIGNDCPEIDTQILLNANQKLNRNVLVLGPATDGGIYLLGIQKEIYHRESFLEMAWQSEGLQISWEAYATDLGQSITWLETHADIDNLIDLQNYIRANGCSYILKKYLISVLASYQHAYIPVRKPVYNSQQLLNTPLRAPPHFSL